MNKKIILSKFDPVEYLDSEKSISAYLESAFESGDTQHIANAIGDALRARSMLKTAQKTGLDRSNLYRSFSNKGDPRLSTVGKVMSTLGYRLSFTKITPSAS